MALRAVIEHPKFGRLKALLQLNKSCTLGYLEALWHFCARYTPAGNVGKYSAEEIEAWLEWDGAPGALVTAFVLSRWIDEDATHHLIIHDWDKYADEVVHTELARRCQLFANGTVPNSRRLNQIERERFHVFLSQQGAQANPVGRPATRNKSSENADTMQPDCSPNAATLQTNAAEMTKPVPVPVPVPVPDTKAMPPSSSSKKTTAMSSAKTQNDPTAPLLPGFSNNGKDPPAKRTPQQYVDFWNKNCGPLAAVKELNENRITKLRTRIARGLTPDKFRAVINRIHATPFCLGDNERGWRVTFDFLIANDNNVTRILEGTFDRAVKPKKQYTAMRTIQEALGQ